MHSIVVEKMSELKNLKKEMKMPQNSPHMSISDEVKAQSQNTKNQQPFNEKIDEIIRA